ncbi:hypothetical protein [Campylobacter hyointestinalis]|uniref:Portal protein n=1 Tax=Campylobacter hyointestinalis subsp. hyointestinalis TaxID=91352 RepID=A0A9W5EQI4_CAMHY|nr:hypothetical protein [Campylobacter hyointestinalis]CUU74277.1 Uncharacterised protein [Campylobacter hyointestinalis subsp. hyointestinalis]CUU82068.1 Uncharacterised protein [Campylobacter hyointestinalis subsp. hyointestinalis]
MLDQIKLKAILEEASMNNRSSIEEFKEAKRYYGGKQLPDDVIATLKERGQPPIHENILAMMIEKIQGYKSMARQDIEVVGRQKQDRDMALVLSDILKSISDSRDFLSEKIASDENLLLGMGVLEVWIKELDATDAWGKKEKQIYVKSIPPTSFLIDPYSQKSDASDAGYFIKMYSLEYDEARVYFGEKVKNLPINMINQYRKRVNIYEFWIKELSGGQMVWNRYYTGDLAVFLKFDKAPLPNGMHPFAIRKYKIDDKGCWYGFFRNLKPQIDFINFAENRMANMIGSSKIFYEDGAVDDAEEFAMNANIDKAVVRVRQGALSGKKLEIVNNQPQISNLSAKIADTRAIAQRLSGFNDEVLGFAVSRLSGSAIEQRNNAGTVSLQSFLLASEMLDKDVFSKAIVLITHFFDAEQVFRISEYDNAARFFKINEKELDANGKPMIVDGKMSIKNKISVGVYDIYLSTVPHTKTKREDILKHWAEIIKTIAPIDQGMVAKLIPLMLDDSDSPIARNIREMLMTPEQEPNPMQDIAMQKASLELEKMKAEINKIKADSLKKVAEGKEEMGRAKI